MIFRYAHLPNIRHPGVYNYPEESISLWKDILMDLKYRGVSEVLLFVADGLKGLENVISQVFPKSDFQKCQVHKMRNIRNKVRKEDKDQIIKDYKQIVLQLDNSNYTLNEALLNLDIFINKWKPKYKLNYLFPVSEREYHFTFLKYPFKSR